MSRRYFLVNKNLENIEEKSNNCNNSKNYRRYVRVENKTKIKTKSKTKKKKINGLIVFILVIIILLFSIYLLKWIITNKRNKDLIKNLIKNEVNYQTVIFDNEQIPIVDLDNLNSNENIKGWIKIDGTNIDYPIMQTNDNIFYLNHNINGEISNSGSIFADYRNNLEQLDKNTIIYGHNMKNNSMFAELTKLYNKTDFSQNKNRYFYFATLDNKYICEIVSVYKIEAQMFDIKNIFSKKEFLSYIDEIKQKSIYNFDTKIDDTDKLITLYTCDDNNKNRIIVQAKLNKID